MVELIWIGIAIAVVLFLMGLKIMKWVMWGLAAVALIFVGYGILF